MSFLSVFVTCTAFSAACELQPSQPPSSVLVEKLDQESSVRSAGHLHDGVFGPMDSDSPVSAVQLSDSTVVRVQGGCCESDTQIFSKEVDKNFAQSATKWMLSATPSGISDGRAHTGDAALGPANIDVNSGVEPINLKV